ncbi:ABC transporter ATP-binding protein [Domibacillus robiginosus]|uniref:ABC transporter ATP-binding protein n=1 Tax=Domibacillus robiginosus TaxID=1071054 RepID=UPI00067C4E71|nr:ABC transporter ATP-binding protein [Domibacillus robiginosus]
MIQVNNVTKKYGSFTALHEVNFHIRKGEFIAILGPSGCGKTTLLKLLAGFMEPSSGDIHIDGRLTASKNRIIPPEKRNIGMVFQSFALWPHMTVYEHVVFPLRHHRHTRDEWKQDMVARAQHVLKMVGLEQLFDRYPSKLSGGQKQRVALARAIAPLPDVLLMDEPLSALDIELRMEMRNEIQRIHRETHASVVYVTHDQGEALAMADQIIVMNNGKIEQIGSPEEVYTKPETAFVASFVGKCNMVKGKWHQNRFVPNEFPWEQWPDIGIADSLKQQGLCPVRPEQWHMTGHKGEGLKGTILSVQYQGKEIHYMVEVENENWTVHQSVFQPKYRIGDTVSLSLKAEKNIHAATL